MTPYATATLAAAAHAMDLDAALAAHDAAAARHTAARDEASAAAAALGPAQAAAAGDPTAATAAAPADDAAAAARTWLHLDGFSMGLGGDDSWSPRTHPQYLLQRHKGAAYRYEPPPPLPPPPASARAAVPQGAPLEPSPAVYAYELWIGATHPGQRPADAAAMPTRMLQGTPN